MNLKNEIKESNLLLCWFCKKNESDPETIIEVPLYKKLHEEHAGFDVGKDGYYEKELTTYHYLPAKVVIARCRKCAKSHDRVGDIANLANILATFLILALVVLYIFIPHQNFPFLESPWSACCYVPAALITILLAGELARGNYLRSRGTSPLGDRKTHPDVLRLIKDGYEIGKSPVDPDPIDISH